MVNNDDFLYDLREIPRTDFADTLYASLAVPEAQKARRGWYVRRFGGVAAALFLVMLIGALSLGGSGMQTGGTVVAPQLGYIYAMVAESDDGDQAPNLDPPRYVTYYLPTYIPHGFTMTDSLPISNEHRFGQIYIDTDFRYWIDEQNNTIQLKVEAPFLSETPPDELAFGLPRPYDDPNIALKRGFERGDNHIVSLANDVYAVVKRPSGVDSSTELRWSSYRLEFTLTANGDITLDDLVAMARSTIPTLTLSPRQGQIEDKSIRSTLAQRYVVFYHPTYLPPGYLNPGPRADELLQPFYGRWRPPGDFREQYTDGIDTVIEFSVRYSHSDNTLLLLERYKDGDSQVVVLAEDVFGEFLTGEGDADYALAWTYRKVTYVLMVYGDLPHAELIAIARSTIR